MPLRGCHCLQKATTMVLTAMGPPPPPPPPAVKPLLGRRVAFTTPPAYANRLATLLEHQGAALLPLPTVAVEATPRTLAALGPYLLPGALDSFAALAFTSRNGIAAFSLALPDSADACPPLSDSGDAFVVAALGKDAEMLHEDGTLLRRICRNLDRILVLVPKTASPDGLVESLGAGSGRRVLCPVPLVVDLEEPPVIPDFVKGLETGGWIVERVPAYETRWMGAGCMDGLMQLDGRLDAVVFTSTAEAEGLTKGLQSLGSDWGAMRRRWPDMLVAVHGPVTAKGVEAFGISVDVVSSNFSSFDGVVDALASKLGPLNGER